MVGQVGVVGQDGSPLGFLRPTHGASHMTTQPGRILGPPKYPDQRDLPDHQTPRADHDLEGCIGMADIVIVQNIAFALFGCCWVEGQECRL